MKPYLPSPALCIRLLCVDTRDASRLTGPGGPGRDEEELKERGLGPWIRRNPSLLLRLFIVMVFSFAASTVASNFSYALEESYTTLTVEQLNRGELPPGTELGDYVQIRGTAKVGGPNARVGLEDSEVAVSSRYQTSYFYFRLEETGDNLLIQTTEGLPRNLEDPTENVWDGKLETVGLRDSEIAISIRYSASYFYYRLQETQGNLLIQTRGSGSKWAIGNGLGIS